MQEQGYLDFHSHILPGVDDGAKSMEETERMLHKAYEQGIRTILATPHNYPGKRPQENETIRELCRQVDAKAQKIDQDFHVLSGNEILYRDSILSELEEGHILTLADSQFLLVEFLPNERYQRINDGLRRIVQEQYYPVIAHVERVECLMTHPERIKELVDMGCYTQANCQDMIGGFFDRRAKALRGLVEQELIHFLGSDCHNLTSRPPIMKDCINWLTKKITSGSLDKVIYDNPARFLQKKYI